MPKAKQKEVTIENKKLINLSALPAVIKKINPQIVMVIALITMSFVVGRLTQKVEDLQGGVLSANTNTNAAGTAQATPAPKLDLATIKDLWSKDVIKFGDANNKLLLVEISDPSCPYCHAADGKDHTIYKALSRDGGVSDVTFKLTADGGSYVSPTQEIKKLVDAGQASFAYVYFPGHGNGEMGMKALYCANEKGKFWQAHDLLMSDSGYTLMNTTVKNDKAQSQAVATFLKSAVDQSFLKSCLDSGKYDQTLSADMALASNIFSGAGLNAGTPGFFVNTTPYGGAYSWTDMKATVDLVLK